LKENAQISSLNHTPDHADRREIILDRLNAANEIKDMNYPGSYLHKLTGDKKGQYSQCLKERMEK
jgi:plasmid maintenance system killer protein